MHLSPSRLDGPIHWGLSFTISQDHPITPAEPEKNPYLQASGYHPPSLIHLHRHISAVRSLKKSAILPPSLKSSTCHLLQIQSPNNQAPSPLNSHSTDAHTSCTYKTSSSAHPHCESVLDRTPPTNPCSPCCCIVLHERQRAFLSPFPLTSSLPIPISAPHIPSTTSPPTSPSASTSSTSFLFISRLS